MIKNIRAVLTPLLIITYVAGLRIFEFPTGFPRLWFSLSYMILFWSIYFFLLIYTVVPDAKIYYTVNYYYCFEMNIFTLFVTIMCGVYYNKKFITSLKRIAIVDDTLEQLGIMTDYKKLHMRTIWFALGWFAIIISMICLEAIWLRVEFGVDTLLAIYYPCVLNYCTHMIFIDDLVAINILEYLGLKFDQINQNLQKLAEDNENKIIQIWNKHMVQHQRRLLKTSSSEYVTWIVIHLHLELRKISYDINSIFGIQWTFKMGLYFSFIAMCFCEVFRAILIKSYMSNDKVEFLFLALFWVGMYVFKLFLINSTCARVSAKANITGNIISNIPYSIHDDEVRENILQFLLQMSQTSVKFYGLRLFQFGLEFFLGFLASVATVIVILIQPYNTQKSYNNQIF